MKQLKKKVDVLTLTATPIPRTLNMAMTGLRDMSIIETPPRDRLAINTQVVQFSENVPQHPDSSVASGQKHEARYLSVPHKPLTGILPWGRILPNSQSKLIGKAGSFALMF